jgi:hypothetical protein
VLFVCETSAHSRTICIFQFPKGLTSCWFPTSCPAELKLRDNAHKKSLSVYFWQSMYGCLFCTCFNKSVFALSVVDFIALITPPSKLQAYDIWLLIMLCSENSAFVFLK